MLNYIHIINIPTVLTHSSRLYIRFALILLLFPFMYSCSEEKICIPEEELEIIGELIFINEGAGKVENLTTWNEGEEFASLGIGHFIWFPRGKEYRFFETFPVVLEFLQGRGAELPPWIEGMPVPELPWSTREEFLREFDSPKMVSLRKFLLETVPLQSLFMAGRLEESLPKILNAASESDREHIKTQFYMVANSPMGMYVLIDYVNFKGEGVVESERYNGQGWGLLQVLREMSSPEPGIAALEDFSDKAEFVLLRRVRNSPPERNEKRWIPGWKNRINTYKNEEYAELVPKRDIFCKEDIISTDRVFSFVKYLSSKLTGSD
jgi:hypothetical protein